MNTQRHSIEIRADVTTRSRGFGRRIRPCSLTCFLSAVLLLILASLPSVAQGPESYGVPHLFALPTATTTRQFGMGGVSTCVEDVGFPNPAFAGMLKTSQAALRVSWTDFDGGLDLTGTQAWYATPVGESRGIQLLGFDLDSDPGTIVTPAGGLPGTIEETDLAIHYGQRLSDRWLVGAGISPVLEAETRLRHPLTGDVVSFTDSEADFGFRLGALYQYADEGFAGVVFDHYSEDVTFQASPAQGPQAFDFTSTEWALGVSGRLSEQVFGAIEWMELKSEADPFEATSEGLHFGIEVDVAPGVALRAGSNDGALSLGAGCRGDGWVVNYAYIDDWNDDTVGAAFGGSETHQLEIGRYW